MPQKQCRQQSKLFPPKWTCLAHTYKKNPLYFISISSIELAHFNNFNELQTTSKGWGEKKCVWGEQPFFLLEVDLLGVFDSLHHKKHKAGGMCVGYYSKEKEKKTMATTSCVHHFRFSLCFFLVWANCRVSVFGCFLTLQ